MFALLLLLILATGVVAAVAHSKAGLVGAAIGVVLALGIFGFLMRFDIEKALQDLEAARAGLPVIAFALTWALMRDTPGTMGFDEIAAQVIVVLLLALAVDARFFRLRGRG